MNFKNGKMMFFIKYYIVLMILFSLVGCSEKADSPNVFGARRVANDFFENIMVENDIDSAYTLCNEKMKDKVSLAELKDNIMQAHQGNLPKTFIISSYETYEENKTVAIFLRNIDSGQKFHYKVTLNGTKKRGYLVSGFDISPPNIEPKKVNRINFEVMLVIGDV